MINEFYDVSAYYGYVPHPYFYMCASIRGGGKTFGWKRQAVKEFLDTGAQFCYVRRYKGEVFGSKGVASSFADDIINYLPQDTTIKVKGSNVFINGKIGGYLVALSDSVKAKSVVRQKVDTIIFDEFIIDNPLTHYIGGFKEPETFLNLCDSILRPRKGNDKGKIILLANCVTWANPYFIYFNVNPFNFKKRQCMYIKSKDILIHIWDNEAYREGRKNTRFGKLTARTVYNDYASEGVFFKDNTSHIKRLSTSAKYRFTIRYKQFNLSVFVNFNTGEHYITTKRGAFERLFAFTREDMTTDTYLLTNNNILLSTLRRAFEMGKVYYENQKICGIMNDFFGRYYL